MRRALPAFAACCLLLSLVPAARAADDGLVCSYSFDKIENGIFPDGGPNRIVARNVGGDLCEGVDGLALRLPGGNKWVSIELPERFRALDAVTVEAWVAPETAAHTEIVTAAAEKITFDSLPIMLRWRADWRFIFEVSTADGERRGLSMPGPCVDAVSFPSRRKWIHVAATYDGETSCVYVDGKLLASRKFPSGRKPIMRIAHPMKVGGHGGLYQGAVDDLRVYARALGAGEVAARAAERAAGKPAVPPREAPGTIDGKPFAGCGRAGSWFVIPLRHARIQLTNTGQAHFWAVSKTMASNQWDQNSPVTLLDQGGRRDRFYTDCSGNIEFRRDGTALLELAGRTHHGIAVKQRIEVTKDDEARFRYEMTAETPRAPAPRIYWPQHLFPGAMRFVGYDETGLITGNILDLDGEVRFRDLVEFNLIISDNRLVVGTGPGTRYLMKSSRSPANWTNGWGNVHAEFVPADWKSWTETPTAVLEFSVKLEPDDAKPRLDRAKARETTVARPFDYTRLYDTDIERIGLVPAGRDIPVFRESENVQFSVEVPKPLLNVCKTYRWTLTESGTGAKVREGDLVHSEPFWEWIGTIVFPAPKPGVYDLALTALDRDGKTVGEAASEAAVVGPIAQRKLGPGERPNLRKVAEADFTAADPGNDFFSYSGRSAVVGAGARAWRKTLTTAETVAELNRRGTPGRPHDWFGVRFRTQPGKVYVLETEYPDIDFMSVNMFLLEPEDEAADGKCRPVLKTTTGIFSGTFLPCDNAIKTHQTVHFASAPWVAVCYQNAHDYHNERNLAPACVRKAVLYEVRDDLPMLDAPPAAGRLVGVHCESGGLAMSSFGTAKFRGELGNWRDAPDPKEFYRYAYPTAVNLVKYMRYRGDTTLFFGVYRYRAAQFPSRRFPPDDHERRNDLAGLLAMLFEQNGLTLIPTVMPHSVLPTSRLQEKTQYDIIAGESGVQPVDKDGLQSNNHVCHPAVNPFHPAVRETYATLADELGARYGKYPAVPAMAWITGQAWWEPCLPTAMSHATTREKAEEILLSAPYDDATIRLFELMTGRTVPVRYDDPGRYRKRYDWIMANAKDAFVEFKCRAMADTHRVFSDAFRKAAPGKDYLWIDFYYNLFSNKGDWKPLEACRLFGSDPRAVTGPGFVHCPYVPEYNGVTHWEHAPMDISMVPRLQAFVTDDELAAAWDANEKSGRYLHRQFYEHGIELPQDPKRKWMWRSDVGRMATCSYPQQGGRGYLADFALMLARGTPAYISYMWSDSTIPMGHEPMHREFAAAYRRLPPGRYREADRAAGLFCRYLEGGRTFYVVNTTGAPVEAEVKTGIAGTFADAVSGAPLDARAGKARVRLDAYQLRVFAAR